MRELAKMGLPLLGLGLVLAASSPGRAAADIDDWTDVPEYTGSPEHFGFELRVGMYQPLSLGEAFSSPDYFGGDIGPEMSMQIHYYPGRIPYLGLIGVGLGLGWSQWDTNRPGGGATDTERNVFEIIVLQPMVQWRFDTLAREARIPIVLTPKLGFDFAHWLTDGSGSTPDGWSIGPRFAIKLSLELDFLEPRAARQLDEEWGINHSELFAEFYYSMAGDLFPNQLPMGGWGWAAGLGFTF